MLETFFPSMWVAHDFRERPFGYGMWLCDCRACLMALQADVVRRPDRDFVLKAGRSRRTVNGAQLLTAMQDDGSAEVLLLDPEDWIREVFVADVASPGRRQRPAA